MQDVNKRIILSKPNGINVLSLFDGISSGMVAFERANIKVDRYVAYEINEHSIKVSKKNYPMIEHKGDVTQADFSEYKDFDILIGGSPCQDISNLNIGGKGLQGEKSGLFYYYLKALKETKPKFFLLENVVGKKEAVEKISELLGVQPIMIDSKLVSAQRRKRYYWTNIPNITQPKDKNLYLSDVVLPYEQAKEGWLKEGRLKWLMGKSGQQCIKRRFGTISLTSDLKNTKCQCLTRRSEGSWNCQYINDNGRIRHLTPIEYERLQTLPDNYTDCIEDKYRYEVLGDGWTVDVIAHIFSLMKQPK